MLSAEYLHSLSTQHPALSTFSPMLIFPAPPRRRRTRRFRSATTPPSPPGVTVVSVSIVDSATLQWIFSVNIIGVDAGCDQLIATDASGDQIPSGVSQTGPDTLWAAYADGNFGEGGSWRVTEEPAGMSFAGGGVLVIPESGNLQS